MLCRITQYCSYYLLFSRHWNQDTLEEIVHSWHLPNHWHFWEMTHLKGEGHRIYILKTPRYLDLPERNPNVIFSQNPCIGPCRTIPLEQLTKGASGRNSKGMELRLPSCLLVFGFNQHFDYSWEAIIVELTRKGKKCNKIHHWVISTLRLPQLWFHCTLKLLQDSSRSMY